MRNETRAPRPARMERRAAGRVGEERAASGRRAGAGIMSRYMCGEQPPPRAAGRPGQRIKSLSSHRAPFVSRYRYTAVRHPGSARVCRRHDAHVSFDSGARYITRDQYTGNTTATASGGSPRPVGVRPDARQPSPRTAGEASAERARLSTAAIRSTARCSQMTTIYQLAIRVLGWQIGNRMRLRAI